MKTYIKPSTLCVNFMAANIVAASPNMGGGVHNEDLGNSSGDLTREKKSGGIGGGLWEDMK